MKLGLVGRPTLDRIQVQESLQKVDKRLPVHHFFFNFGLGHAFLHHRVAVDDVRESGGLEVSFAGLLHNVMFSRVGLHRLESVPLWVRCVVVVAQMLRANLFKELVRRLSNL